MPYTQEQYDRAKSAVSSGGIPPDKLPVVQTRLAEFEDAQDRGFQTASLAAGATEQKFPSLGEVGAPMESFLHTSKSPTAEAIQTTMDPAVLEARRVAWEKSRDLTRDRKLPTASKLKIFDDPAEYQGPPSPLPGMLGSGVNAVRPVTSYFEPTVDEFRTVIQQNPTIRDRLQEQYPDHKLEELPDSTYENSDAYKVYSDARWQHALGESIKTKTPITRVAFSAKTGAVDPNSTAKDPKTGLPIPGSGKRELNATGHLSNLMDSTMALGSGAIQGFTGGLADLVLSLGGDVNKRRAQVAEMTGDNIEPLDPATSTDLRDAARGSMERNPTTTMLGEVAGALSPRGVPGKVTGLIQKGMGGLGGLLPNVLKPNSLVGRVGAAAAVGGTQAVLDENIRAAAKLAADALDADKTARETVLSLQENLPGLNPTTAILGSGVGAAADLAGAGLGALKNSMVRGDRLRQPLKNFDTEGGQMGPFMGRKLEPRALELRNRAEAGNTSPEALVVENARQPLARQRLKEQEAVARKEDLATNVNQAGLEGIDLPSSKTADLIRAEAQARPGAAPKSASQQRAVTKFADKLRAEGQLTADRLDAYIKEAADEANYASSRGEPVEAWDNVSRYLHELRDELPNPRTMDEATVVTDPPDKGLFTADPDVTIKTPPDKAVAGIRDKYGNVKPVEGYSAEKTRQSRQLEYQHKTNERLGLPRELQAESVLATTPDKGLFSAPGKDVVSGIEPNVKLSKQQQDTYDAKLRAATGDDYHENRAEFDALAERADPKIAEDIRNVRQIKASNKLGAAMGQAIDQLGSAGYLNIGMLKRMGFRSIPTLNSLSGGLVDRLPVHPSIDQVNRMKTFIPEWEILHLRGGKPSRVIGAFRDEQESKESEFSPEEKAFWIKVIDQMAKNRKAAGT